MHIIFVKPNDRNILYISVSIISNVIDPHKRLILYELALIEI